MAIVLGVVALVRLSSSGARGRGMALAAILIGAVELVLAVVAAVVGVVAVRSIAPLPADVASPQQAQVRQLVVGNCVRAWPTTSEVDDVIVVPCTEPHQAAVVGRHVLADGTWPGQTAADREAARVCSAGASPDGTHLVALAPTQTGWSRGDRVGLCVAVTG